MCGRYYLKSPGKAIKKVFDLAETPALDAHYNIAPTQEVPVVRQRRSKPERALEMMRWGLIPFWAKDMKIGAHGINARSETAASKPQFREAMANRRCLIPADGFFEWKKVGKERQPWAIQVRSQQPFALGGLWERWKAPDGQTIVSCAILTTGANALIAPLHDRMPLILPQGAWEQWLDPNARNAAELRPLLVPYPSDDMQLFRVDTRVNKTDNDDPVCIAPLAAPQFELDV